jgi:hypothetical protein
MAEYPKRAAEENKQTKMKKPFDKEGFLIFVSPAQFLACGGIFDYFFN